MILVLSNMFLPGPEAKHISFLPGQVYCFEQLLPENSHFGPRVLGETSPRLLEAKAATNGPWSQPISSITILLEENLVRLFPFIRSFNIHLHSHLHSRKNTILNTHRYIDKVKNEKRTDKF